MARRRHRGSSEADSIEWLGVDGATDAGEVSQQHQIVRRTPATSPLVVVALLIVGVAYLTLDRSDPVPELGPVTERADVPVTLPQTEERGAASGVEPNPSTPRARYEPVIEGVDGLVVVAGRGTEKVFVDLGTGERRVADIDGMPVATVGRVVALADLAADAPRELCWFDVDRRQCQVAPPSGSVHEFDLEAVRELRALSPDARWSAEWVGGQIVVTDLRSGEEHTVPDVTRTYFEDGLVLIGG